MQIMDYMDEILAVEKGVFNSLEMGKSNSMTSTGQCRLAPLIVCIQVHSSITLSAGLF